MKGMIMGMIGRLLFFLLCLPLLAVLLAACGEKERETRIATSVRDQQARPPVEEPAPELLSTQASFIEVSQKVTPSVVNISTARTRSTEVLPPFFEDFFGEFFRSHPPVQRKEQSLGSGVIISADGFILTNEHVIRGAEEIKVKLSDQRVYDGTVIGGDPRTDVAVVKIDANEDLPAAVLGNSDDLKVGQWALAIGNPFGLDRTLTVGVISATGRTNVGIEDYEDFIQTDASINPGNSGGPLLNIYGEVVGVNTAIVASGQGIGFAIPINLARLIADQLIEKGEVTRGWLGVSLQPLTTELAQSFGLNKIGGALVNQVFDDSPAATAGVRRGDILLTFAGKEIRGVRELQLLVASTPAGKTEILEVLRDGKIIELEVRLAAQNEGSAPKIAAGQSRGLGMTVTSNAAAPGVKVVKVDEGSAAAQAGIREGDVVLAVNHEEVKDAAAFERTAKKVTGSKNVVLLVQRGQTTLYLAFPAP
ncbi:DegQ family serine endoprotease [Desulfuromonas sp. AOP6]|uniref:DegQ family serine endoprotease n=1 Tax=Desulfuromonas sp. AOP6 TaxID=1566351 RepID=UPI001CEC013F|nr:DegQ family serine endoprotease [Desulfuromonas sp. AOP6]